MYSIEKAIVNQIPWAKKHISVSMAFEPDRMGRFLGKQWNLKEKRRREGQWTAADKSGRIDWIEYALALSRS